MSQHSPSQHEQSSDRPESPRNDEETDGKEDNNYQEEGKTECPSGWYPFPSHWTILEKGNGELGAMQLMERDGQQRFTVVENIDCMTEEEDGKKFFFWRNSRVTDPESEMSPFTKIKCMSEAMSALSRLTTGIDKAPSILIEESKHPQVKIQTNSATNFRFPDAGSLSDAWSAKVNDVLHKKNSPEVKPPCTFTIKWPSQSDNEQISKFLSAPKLKAEEFNYNLKPFPSSLQDKIKNDFKMRKKANLAFQANSIIELMNEQFKAAAELTKVNSKFDSKMVVKLVSEMTTGVSAFLKPLTQELVKECITTRTTLGRIAFHQNSIQLKKNS